MLTLNTARIGIIGLGYVGLPLAVVFDIKSVFNRYAVTERL